VAKKIKYDNFQQGIFLLQTAIKNIEAAEVVFNADFKSEKKKIQTEIDKQLKEYKKAETKTKGKK